MPSSPPGLPGRGMPGAAVRVVKDGNDVLYAREYGLADIVRNVPIIPETAFLLASLTKQFTHRKT